jgi:predicted 3-demethylubiquinone-9 3-methyltransferase (glyoxalase superfamily)
MPALVAPQAIGHGPSRRRRDGPYMDPEQRPKLVPHLWYASEAEEAARFYASVFPDSSVDKVSYLPADSPSGPAGSVAVVRFTLFGQPFLAIDGGPHQPFNDAVSFLVLCDSQEELDRYWDALVRNGAEPQACGWIADRYGLRWQIVPRRLHEMLDDPDPERARRVAEEMLRQVKFDLAKLEAAYRGT